MPASLIINDPSGNEIINTSRRLVRFHAVIAVSHASNPTGSQTVSGADDGELFSVVIQNSLREGPVVTRSGSTISWSNTPVGFVGDLWIGTF